SFTSPVSLKSFRLLYIVATLILGYSLDNALNISSAVGCSSVSIIYLSTAFLCGVILTPVFLSASIESVNCSLASIIFILIPSFLYQTTVIYLLYFVIKLFVKSDFQ